MPITETSALEYLETHPDEGSLLAYVDALNHFNIENAVIKIEQEDLITLPTPFIAFSHIHGGTFLVVKNLALTYQRKVMSLLNNDDPKINQKYLEYLISNKEYEEAGNVARDFISSGVSNSHIDSLNIFLSSVLKYKTKYSSEIHKNEAKFKEAQFKKGKYILTSLVAPTFSLKDLHGNLVQLSDYKGQILILDFWATWCKPCIKSFPAMKELMIDLQKENINMLFIDTFEESVNRDNFNLQQNILELLNSQKMEDFRVAIDPMTENINQIANLYNVTSIPTKVIIDRGGMLRYKSSGFLNEKEMITEIKSVIQIIDNK